MAHANPGNSLAERAAKDFTTVAKQAIPAVVAIKVKSTSKTIDESSIDPFSDEFFQFFFNPKDSDKKIPVVGQASGYIVSPEGYIITNNHVVNDVSDIEVALNDGRIFKAKVIGQDPNTDIAVLKIDASNLPFLKLGNSDDLDIGQWAIAIGNPFGLQATLTVGVISAKGRNNLDLAGQEDFIQTDASINRGNSGGPLLNLDGKVIGMNTAIVSSGGGIGFAIPSNMIKHIMEQLINNGKVVRGFVGISMQEITQDLAHAFGLPNTNGALVAEVTKGSPAEKAGIKQGDIIQAYNKVPVANLASLRNAIALMNPGTAVNFSILRKGQPLAITVSVGTYPTDGHHAQAIASKEENLFGFEVKDLSAELGKTLGVTGTLGGVVITNVSSNTPAAWAGLKKGTLILEANQQAVTSAAQFNNVLNSMEHGKPLLLLVRQGEAMRFISLKVN